MYDELTPEEAIQLAIEFVSAGVSLPDALWNKLDSDTLKDIHDAAKE